METKPCEKQILRRRVPARRAYASPKARNDKKTLTEPAYSQACVNA